MVKVVIRKIVGAREGGNRRIINQCTECYRKALFENDTDAFTYQLLLEKQRETSYWGANSEKSPSLVLV